MSERTAVIDPAPVAAGTSEEVAGIAAAIAATLRSTPDRWGPQPEPHPTERTGVRVIAIDECDVWLLRWPSGTRVAPHDHGESVGAFSVVRGELLEVRWHAGAPVTRRVHDGETVDIDRGVVHDVVGATDGALSVHVYSPPLASMGFYDEEGAMLLVRQEVVDH
jgi:quercetin dioxygenase-like cupin family protein